MVWVAVGAKALATVDFERFYLSASQVRILTHAVELIGTGGVVLAIALFVCLSGFVVWFVVSDQ